MVPFPLAGMVASLVLVLSGILAWALLNGRAFKEIDTAYPVPLRAAFPEPALNWHERQEDGHHRDRTAFDATGMSLDRSHTSRQLETVGAYEEPYAGNPVSTDFEDGGRNVASTGSGGALDPRQGQAGADGPGFSPDFWEEFDKRAANAEAGQDAGPADRPLADPAQPRDDGFEPGAGRLQPGHAGSAVSMVGAARGPEAAGQASVEMFAVRDAMRALDSMDRARIAIVSPAGDEGSVLAWEIVRRLAAAGRSALVVDLTGSGVTSQEFTGSAETRGLRELLAHKLPLREAVHQDVAGNALILPAGRGPEAGPDSLARLAATSRALSDAFDFVIFDCGMTGPEGLENIAPHDSIVIISAEGAEPGELAAAEAGFRGAGFGETIVVGFDAVDRRRRLVSAA